MSTQSPLPQNDPMLIAFQKLKHTPEYKNAVNWTIKAENESQADGELWFGFAAGWNAHASHTAALRDKALMTERSTVIEEAIKTISLWANDRGIAEQIADFAIAYHAKQNASGTVRLCFKCAGEESLVLEGVCANGER